MDKLSGQDALFLHLDLPHAASHVTMIYIYDQTTVSQRHLRFREIVRHIERRLDASPMFRRKIVQSPLGLGYPYWADDDAFDIDFHVRHFALPKPGDWRQFCILAARVHARTMDLSRPPWEMYVIEGLDNVAGVPKGSFAILTKMHHAAVDGSAAAELTWALHDVEGAKGKSIAVLRKKPRVGPQTPAPGFVDTVTRVLTENMSSAVRMAAPLARVLPKLTATGLKAIGRALFSSGAGVPRTRFNGDIVAGRVFDSVSIDLADVKQIKDAVPGATVNDAVLAIIGGAMRRYLLAKSELPERSLVALAPVNTRQDGGERATSGNTISFVTFSLGTHIADPIVRLEAVHGASAQTKALNNAIGARDLTDISKFAPPATLAFAGRLGSLTGMGGKGPVVLHNCIVTNVPGPNVPLYLLGAKLVYWSGVGPVTDGTSLVWAVSSYCGRMFISLTSAPNIVADPHVLARCVMDSFKEMKAAAVGRGTATETIAKKAPRKTGEKRGGTKKSVVKKPATKVPSRTKRLVKTRLRDVVRAA
jgi:diacylglycerol O-acyltransferase